MSVSRRLSACLANDACFWSGCAWLLAILAVLKGLRIPGLWAATQASFDYRGGFIKRGLFGAFMRLLDIPIERYQVFVTVSVITLAAFFAILIVWIARSGVHRLADGSLLALFAGSYCVTFLTHMIGYLDIPSAILALIALLSSRSRGYFAVVLVCGVLGVLLHENYLLTFLPVTLLPGLLQTPRQWGAITTVAAIVGGVVVVEALAAPMDARRLANMMAEMQATLDFPPRREVIEILGRSSIENLSMMLTTMRTFVWWMLQAGAFIAFMPTAALFIRVSFRGAASRFSKACILMSALCPLSLQLVGWDIYRWYALASFCSFLALTVVYRHSGMAVSGPAVRNLVMLLIAVNMATGIGLFDYYHVDTFPFIDHWRNLGHWLSGGGRWPMPVQ